MNNDLELLPIQPEHIYALDQLPQHHRDPFDRMIIAQAIVEHLPVLTVDPMFAKYPVNTVG